MRFPDRSTQIGAIIDQYLKSSNNLGNEVIHLLYSANRWEVADKIKDTLENGTSIICDRYWYSGTAYDVAKGLPLEWCKATDMGLPKPDLVFFIDSNPELLAKREGYGDERYDKLEFQKKVRDAYLELREDNWILIDGNKTLNEVRDEVCHAARSFLENSNAN
ncbi:Thymidylate kinase [Histomonas meleagridis]|uniref:Thymidylate kinase n=1 Tax=Histomonas meleagridis TaxID=135588 RepID=UPI0035593C7A|nr:Thymidylate kinase [Histomonas meleagridis]KAH0798028.1 Thymidylate kinase [Histomonas meleagridis]